MGSNEYGQIGAGKITKHNIPTLMKRLNDTIGSIHAGGDSSILYSIEKQMFIAGKSILCVYYKCKTPTQIRSIVHLSLFSILLDSNGVGYGFGENQYGQLGVGNKDTIKEPIPMKFNKKIIRIEASSHHTLLLDEKGIAYSMGLNNFGQLGIGSLENKDIPTPISFADKDLQIYDIAAGYEHSLFIDHKGNVFGVGNNDKGQLGIGNNDNQITPKTMYQSDVLSNKGIIQISTNAYHSVLLDLEGIPYATGNNDQGQLGIGSIESKNIPTPMDRRSELSNVLISQVAAGKWHSLLLDFNGHLYGTGGNNHHQLESASLSPEHITNLPYFYIAAGQSFSIALVGKRKGKAYLLGRVNETSQDFIDQMTPYENCKSISSGTNSYGIQCFDDDEDSMIFFCKHGWVLSTENTFCVPCRAGFYCPNQFIEIPCPPGTYSLSSMSKCIPCPSGTVNINIAGSSYLSCTSCSSGFYAKNSSLPCEACPFGSYCPYEKMVKPILCPSKTHSFRLGSISVDTCKPCREGYMCKNGTIFHPELPCSEGYFANYSNLSNPECSLCPPGSFCKEGIRKPCHPGTFSKIESSTCQPCTAGFYCPFMNTSLASRQECPAGYFCPSHSIVGTQYPCEPGTFSDSQSLSCSLCTKNSYSSSWQSTRCDPCTSGCQPGSTSDINFYNVFNTSLASDLNYKGLDNSEYESKDVNEIKLKIMLIVGGIGSFILLSLLCLIILSLCASKILNEKNCIFRLNAFLQSLFLPLDKFKKDHHHPLNQPVIFRKTELGGLFTIFYHVFSIVLFILMAIYFFMGNVETKTEVQTYTNQHFNTLLNTIEYNLSLIHSESSSVFTKDIRFVGFAHTFDFSNSSNVDSKSPLLFFNNTIYTTYFLSKNPMTILDFHGSIPYRAFQLDLGFTTLNLTSNEITYSNRHVLEYLFSSPGLTHLCGTSTLKVGLRLNEHFKLPSVLSNPYGYFKNVIGIRSLDPYYYITMTADEFNHKDCAYQSSTSGYDFSLGIEFNIRNTKTTTTESIQTSIFSLLSTFFAIYSILFNSLAVVLIILEYFFPLLYDFIATKKKSSPKNGTLNKDDDSLVEPFIHLDGSSEYEMDDDQLSILVQSQSQQLLLQNERLLLQESLLKEQVSLTKKLQDQVDNLVKKNIL